MYITRLNSSKAENFYNSYSSIAYVLMGVGLFAVVPLFTLIGISQPIHLNPAIISIALIAWVTIIIVAIVFYLAMAGVSSQANRYERAARESWVKKNYGLSLTKDQLDTLFFLGAYDEMNPTFLPGITRYGSITLPGYTYGIEAVVVDKSSSLGAGLHLVEADPSGLKELAKR